MFTITVNQTIVDNLANKINSKEKQSNKVTSLSSSSTNTQYPSAKAVYDAIQLVDGGGSGLDVDDFYIDTTTDEIVIVTGSGSGGGSSVTIDSTWVTNSTNPVESQLIKSALDGKADSNHTHSQYLTSHQSLTGYLQTTDVVDNLTSTSTTAPLSAKQGKELNDKIGNILTIINGNGGS